MAVIQENDRKAAFLFVGDFNAHHREWLNSVSPTDCHGRRALDFSTESGCDQLIHRSTHRSGNIQIQIQKLYFRRKKSIVYNIRINSSDKIKKKKLRKKCIIKAYE